MRIVHINSYSNGSTGHIANSVHKALLSQGHESLFAYGSGPDIAQGGYRISNKLDGFVHTVVTLFTGLHGYSSVFSTWRLIKEIKKFDPDVVHLHNLHGGYLNIGILFKYLKKAGLRTVITIHDCWLYTGKCYHYYEAKCDKYLHDCGSCPQLSMYPKSYFFDFTRRMLRDKKAWISQLDDLHIITISDWLREQAKESFLGKYPISTIRNGINDIYRCLGSVDSGLVKAVGGRFVILGVASSWNAHKGVHDFIKLARMLSEDEVIVLVGHMKRDIVLPENILVVDHTQNMEELVRIYNLADVYVSMSTEETFGLTIVEALACGTPAVVYRATACPETVIEGINGYVALPHDTVQVYDYIQQIKKRNLTDEVCISESARQQYSMLRMTQEYLSFYRGF